MTTLPVALRNAFPIIGQGFLFSSIARSLWLGVFFIGFSPCVSPSARSLRSGAVLAPRDARPLCASACERARSGGNRKQGRARLRQRSRGARGLRRRYGRAEGRTKGRREKKTRSKRHGDRE